MKKCSAVVLLLLAACVTAHRHGEKAEKEDRSDDGFMTGMSEEKCKEMIMIARGRFRENKKPVENFINEYLCSNIGEKKVGAQFILHFKMKAQNLVFYINSVPKKANCSAVVLD